MRRDRPAQVHPAALQAHYDAGVTVTLIMRIRTKSGAVYGFTDLDVDLPYDPSVYDPGNTGDDWGLINHKALNGGFELSRIEGAADLSVDNAEAIILPGDDSITPQQLIAGYLDSADVRIYRVNYMDLSMGQVRRGRQAGEPAVVAQPGALEFLSLVSQLKQPEAEFQRSPAGTCSAARTARRLSRGRWRGDRRGRRRAAPDLCRQLSPATMRSSASWNGSLATTPASK